MPSSSQPPSPVPATPEFPVAARFTDVGLQQYLRAYIRELPTLTDRSARLVAAPLSRLASDRSHYERDVGTLRFIITLTYVRVKTDVSWAPSAALLFHHLGAQISPEVQNHEDPVIFDVPPIRGAALVRKTVHLGVWADLLVRSNRTPGVVALLGEFYLLPNTSPLHLQVGRIRRVVTMLIEEPREESGRDVDVLLHLLRSIKTKLDQEEDAEANDMQLRDDLLWMTVSEDVPAIAKRHISDLVGSWDIGSLE